MIVTHRNNRLVPVLLIVGCIWLVFCLIDGNVNNWTGVIPAARLSQPSQAPGQRPAGAPTVATSTTASAATAATAADRHGKPGHDGSRIEQNHGKGNLTASDVLLIMKTGSTSMWKRLLVHLATTLSPDRIPLDNTVIYSDFPETIGSFTIIDVLANTTAKAKTGPDFDVYRQHPEYAAHNAYVEAAGVDGDSYGPPGGWIIDKYKFIPLMQHAGTSWPRAKWYIYMEDDTYLFLPSVLAYLSGFDWREPHYLGSYAAKSNVTFAHGGAGFALSRGAWERSFGANPGMSDDYEEYTAAHCCGDQVLGHALNRYGVRFGENGGDEKFTWGFNPIVHWRFAFERWNWCSRLFSWHKVHNRDVARYYAFESAWDYSKPLRHRDFFMAIIAPNLRKRAEWWDNLSSVYQVSSGNQAAPPAPESGYDEALWRKAWESVDACEAACESWAGCVQWNYVEDLCSMDDKLIMGRGYAPGMPERKTALKRTSGWLKERLDDWQCS